MGARGTGLTVHGLWTLVTLPILVLGGMYAGFEPSGRGDSNWFDLLMVCFAYVMPFVAMAKPTRLTLLGGGLGMAVFVALGVAALQIPLLGIAVLLVPAIWYACAVSLWRQRYGPRGAHNGALSNRASSSEEVAP